MRTLRYLILAAAAMMLAFSAFAVPAKPGVFTRVQPDGSIVLLERHGDEFFHWTTLAGTSQAVAPGRDGYWHNTVIAPERRLKAANLRRSANTMRQAASAEYTDMSHGERHIPVLLVEFQDVKFSVGSPQAKFDALLNLAGYSENGGTGSVRDYYLDNSHGAFKPVFDVYGPVTLPHAMAYYGGNDEEIDFDGRPEIAFFDAAVLLDGSVDFSRYDYDSDGYVDMTLFYYAGYNEAEGGPEDSIWPHQWSAQGSSSAKVRSTTFDGKRLAAYFCTSELRGSTGINMCGIGTTCHEFAHSLGLPDFYDTDYAENGYAGALYSFSVMCSGSYNNNGFTPPYLNAEERIILGWMKEEDAPWLGTGAITLPFIDNNAAYKIPTSTEGEYFLLECRGASGWDKPLPAGLVVYHVDKSPSRVIGEISAYQHWAYWRWYNTINAYGSHPCFYVVPAASPTSLSYTGELAEMVFPGSRDVTHYTPVDWSGKKSGSLLYNIFNGLSESQFSSWVSTGATLSDIGCLSIFDPGAGEYSRGDALPLMLMVPDGITVRSQQWSLDGKPVDGQSVTLGLGRHILEAEVYLSNSTTERIQLVLNAR